MAGRIRTMKPEELDDEVLCSLSDTAWRLRASMRLLADDYGNVRASPRYLASQVWQDSARDADTPLAELVSKRLVVLYEADGQSYAHLVGWDSEQRIDNRGKPRVPSVPPELLAAVRGEIPRLAETRGDSRRNSANRGEPPRTAENRCEVGGGDPASPRLAENLGEPPRTAETLGDSPLRARTPDLRPPTSDPDLRSPTTEHEGEKEDARAREEAEQVRRSVQVHDTSPLFRALHLVCKSPPGSRLMHAVASIGERAAASDAAAQLDATVHAIKFVETYGRWRRCFSMQPAWSPEAIEQHAVTVQRIMAGEEEMPSEQARGSPRGRAADIRRGRAPVSDWSDPT